MPIYEFKCTECENVSERTKKMSDDKSSEKCELCGNKMTQQIARCNFHLKGTGWYVTDFKNKDDKKTKSNDDQPIKKQESKPAEKKKDTEKK